MLTKSLGRLLRPHLEIAREVHQKKQKRMKARTLLSLCGFERRSEQNVRNITERLFGHRVVVAPSLLKGDDGWESDIDGFVLLLPTARFTYLFEPVISALQAIRADARDPSAIEQSLFDMAEKEPEDPTPYVLLYLLWHLRDDSGRALAFAQAALRRAPESSAPWLCVAHYVAFAGYDDVEALRCFYEAEKYADTILERAYALSWIRHFKRQSNDKHYLRKADKRLQILASTRLHPLPDESTPLVDVFYRKSMEILGLHN